MTVQKLPELDNQQPSPGLGEGSTTIPKGSTDTTCIGKQQPLCIKIYTLADPDTKEIRYVGKTKYDLGDRLSKHLCTKEDGHRANWVRKLRREGKKPLIELLEEVSEANWIGAERYWIEQLKAWGFTLINGTSGGESGIISPQCREAQLNSVRNRRQSTEEIEYRTSHLRKAVCQYSKEGLLINTFCSASEAARTLGGNLSHITECCNRVSKRKSHKGFIWRYKDEDIV